MILQNNNGKTVNFLHIPRTAGRYVATLLTNNGYDYAPEFPASGYRTIMWEGKELLHLNLEEENRLMELCHINTPDIRFTVIRNPVEKFISFSNVFENFIKTMNLTWKDMEVANNFYEIMENVGFLGDGEKDKYELAMGMRRLGNNAYIDQRNFIDDTVKVWRFEDGLGSEFVNWLNEIGLEDVELTPVEYRQRSFDNHKTEFTDKMLDIIYNYFEEECKHFGYDK